MCRLLKSLYRKKHAYIVDSHRELCNKLITIAKYFPVEKMHFQALHNGLTRYWESWTDYLTTASRLYKYPFADQLMIYAQRPDATACAEFDIWRNRMNRYVRRGSKGIALLDESSGFPRLHYVFDVSDTGVRRNSRDPEVWQYNDDLKQPVSEMLAATYGISGERVSQQLADVAGKLVAD